MIHKGYNMAALIGYTGFVGSSILSQTDEKFLKFNSSNIQDIRGDSFDYVICAGAPGQKWLANKNPEEDFASIQKLMDCLSEVKTKDFILISTVDVYPDPYNVNENTIIDKSKLQPYGLHRLLLEEFVRDKFNNSFILRLPGLVGPGLRKNIIYDMAHNNGIDKINGSNVFQFYPMVNIWKDICILHSLKSELINLATEPISAQEVADVFGIKLVSYNQTVNYNVKSKYNEYYYSKSEVIKYIKEYCATVNL